MLPRLAVRANGHRCVDCHGVADEWSYNHADPDYLETGTDLQYSLDPAFYDPRCHRCHKAFDRQYRIAELRAIAGPIAPQVRHAVGMRDRARRHRDRQAEDWWDDQLERLVMPLANRVGLPKSVIDGIFAR